MNCHNFIVIRENLRLSKNRDKQLTFSIVCVIASYLLILSLSLLN